MSTSETVHVDAAIKDGIARAEAHALDSVVPAASGAAVVVRGEKGERGEPGKDGANGRDGKDGYTPVKGVDYFDGANGRDGRDGIDGKDGANGKDGADGRTPVKGVDYFDGKDGRDGVDGKDGYTPIKGIDYFDGQPGKDGKDGKDGSDATATDVQINGTSITIDGVANIPMASKTAPGAFKLYQNSNGYGIEVDPLGAYLLKASDSDITARSNRYKPIVPNSLDFAVKAAMTDGKGAAWTADEQSAARTRLGVPDAVTDDHINALIDAKLGVIENGSY